MLQDKRSAGKSITARPQPQKRPLWLEPLEDRRLLAASPYLVRDLELGASSGLPTFGGASQTVFVVTQGAVFFSPRVGTGGDELWKTDGTGLGTVQVKDINPNASSELSDLTNVNGMLFFAATDNSGLNTELWRSDGTPEGTAVVKDIWPGTDSHSEPKGLTNFNGTLLFHADDGTHGRELWKSNGSAAGTVLVKDIQSGNSNSITSGDSQSAVVNGAFFFPANDGTGGTELWKSDGTPEGTVLVKDIQPGPGGSGPRFLTNVNGTLYFRANDGTSGVELWKSDGTEAGTVLVRDIQSGNASSDTLLDSNSRLTSIGNTVYFRADDGTNGRELWKTDGTEAGTVLVKDVRQGTATSSVRYLVDVDGTLYFLANDGVHGFELWKSDGTEAGTSLVRDVVAGTANGAGLSQPVNFNGTLYFSANDGSNGLGLWKSDGTEAGTILVNRPPENPGHFVSVNDRLLFTGNDAEHGQEVWALDADLLLDLNGPPTGNDFGNTWAHIGPVNIADTMSAAIKFANEPQLLALYASLLDPHAGDVLAANTTGTGITSVFDGQTLVLSGPANVAEFQQVLRTITYNNTSGGPGVSSLTIELAVEGGTQFSNAPTTTIYIAPSSTVIGRRLFYNQSGTVAPLRYDGNSALINANDDLAIATDKVAYLPGSGAATFANVSSYTKGINGIMVDIAGAHGTITAADFILRVGSNNTPNSWVAAPAPSSISVRAGAGTSGSDRVVLTWANGAITKKWLEVIVLANANTGLSQKAGYPAGQGDVFFFGNAVANSGAGDNATQAIVNVTDELGARNNPAGVLTNIPITNLFDYNRDGQVNTTDSLASRNNPTNAGNVVRFISVANPPTAPEASPASDDGGVASALSATSAGGALTGAGVPRWLVSRLQNVDLNSGPIARYFEHLADQNTPAARKILVAADKVAEEGQLDDSLLDSLLAELGFG